MKKISLNGLWQGRCSEKPELSFQGNVPGSVLDDLIQAGYTESDIFYRANAETVQPFENYGWVYTKQFYLDGESDNYCLYFERLDTYCDIYVNNSLAGSCENGFIPHQFNISGQLRRGENTIEVYFYSPIKKVMGKKPRMGAFTTERLYTRRMQCTYGWDWTMRFVTCGICGDVCLVERGGEAQVENVYIYTKNVDEESAQLGLEVRFENLRGEVLRFEIYDRGNHLVKVFERYCDERFVKMGVELEHPRLWYPSGYGEPHLYTLKIKRIDGGELYKGQFGVRAVKLMQLRDEPGSENFKKCMELKKSSFSRQYDNNTEFSGFTLKVNDIKVMCKGANWVPCEPFQNGRTKEKITDILELAKEAGVNMLRVWGGGVFETEHFYDECSRLGIMVTQDFMMACGRYPEDEQWFLEQLAAEAEYASVFLRNQPCLMWWSGDNENAVEGCETDADYPGRKSACHAIAPVMHRNDPSREFLPSSPYGGEKYASNTVGTTHNTQFLDSLFRYFEEKDLSGYQVHLKNYRARFIAEEPSMGAAGIISLKKFMPEEDIFGDDLSMWKYHTKSNPCLQRELFDYTCMFAEKVLGDFKNGHDRYFKLKYIQYEWVRVSMEQARREKWFCSGILYWMLNDCWPAASGWSFIDYYGMPKASYYSFKRCAAPVVCSIDCENGKCIVYACNDTLEKMRVVLSLRFVHPDGTIRAVGERTAEIAANSVTTLFELPEPENEATLLVAELHCGSKCDRAFYKKGTLPLVKKTLEYEISDVEIIVRADEYIHVVEIEGSVILDDNYFSLLPGEKKKIAYRWQGGRNAGDIQIAAYGF